MVTRTRRWLAAYDGPLPPTQRWWSDAACADALATVASLVELVAADDCSTLARQCARDELDDWIRQARTGDDLHSRLLVAYAASLATTSRFARSTVLLRELGELTGVPLVVAAAAHIGAIHVADRWRADASVNAAPDTDQDPVRAQLIEYACRVADRGPLAVELVALFDATFRTTATTVVAAVVKLCEQIPAGFPTRVARTLVAEWDGDPRDIPAAVATLT